MPRLPSLVAVPPLAVALSDPGHARAEPPALVTESYTIPSADPGIVLFLREKHLADTNSFAADRILLFARGATYRKRCGSDGSDLS